MKRLKNKVFFLIWGLLSFSMVGILVFFNVQKYKEKKDNIINSLVVAMDNEKKHGNDKDMPIMEPENVKFMDSVIYTILLDEFDNIKDVINHSNNNISDELIKDLGNSILKDKDIKDRYIGSLYSKDYFYSYKKGNVLVIYDNNNVRGELIGFLGESLLIFILLEVGVVIVSRFITRWIITPVILSFSKQKEFVADASHELKTPLSVIIASGEALEKDIGKNKWLDNIKEEAERMNSLVNDLLELAKSEQRVVKYEEKNLSKVVELTTLAFMGCAYEKDLKIEYDIFPNIKMNMDENSIREVIEILLDNAICHASPKSTIKVFLKLKNNNIVLEVQNEGEGIKKGEEELIFERFYRSDKARDRSSGRYGLGLAILKNIVLNHKGSVVAFSKDNITTFRIIFKI